MISAPGSGSGKTLISLVLLGLLRRKGLKVAPFKAGPDYIDPMYHKAVTGRSSYNLDTYLGGSSHTKAVYSKYSKGHDIALIEAAMGYYDGIGGNTTRASAYELASLLGVPVILVVSCRGTALTDSAVIRGLMAFRKDSNIAGFILNKCSWALYERIAPVMEEECGIPCLGYMPSDKRAEIGTRHLGLVQAGEVDDIIQRIDALCDIAMDTIDLDRIIDIVAKMPDLRKDINEEYTGEAVCECEDISASGKACGSYMPPDRDRISGQPLIAIARDRAFTFIYDELIDCLEERDAKCVFFSPIKDSALPEGTCGIYIPGGYPELYLKELSSNHSMLSSIRDAFGRKIALIAECGGYMYLSRGITDEEGHLYKMAGLFPEIHYRTGGLVRFGYASMKGECDSLLLKKGQELHIHSFHHYDIKAIDAVEDKGACMELTKAGRDISWREGHVGDFYYAGYPHLYLPGAEGALDRFLAAAERNSI